MFLSTQLHEEIIDANKDRYAMRIGNCVPDNAINLAYYYNKKILPDSSLLVSEAPKNIIDHKVVEQWVTKRALTSMMDDYFATSIPYHDEDGYSGQLQRKFIDWTTNTHTEKETRTDTRYVNALTSNFALLIDRSNFTDGLYAGTEYLMEVNWAVTGTTNMLKPDTVSRECVAEIIVDGQSSPSYNFPPTIPYSKDNYIGTLVQNGSPIADKEFVTGASSTVTKIVTESIAVAGQAPSQKSFIGDDGVNYVLNSYTEGKTLGTIITTPPQAVDHVPVSGETKSYYDPDTGETLMLTYVEGSYTANSVTSDPVITYNQSYGLSNYIGGTGVNDVYGYSGQGGHWQDTFPALMADVYGRGEGNAKVIAAFKDDPETGTTYHSRIHTDSDGTTTTIHSNFSYDIDAANKFAGNNWGTAGMLWLDTFYDNGGNLPCTYMNPVINDLDMGSPGNLPYGGGKPIGNIRYTIAFYKWTSTTTVTTTKPTAIWSGKTKDTYGLTEVYQGQSDGAVSTSYRITQRYHNKLTKDASYISPVPSQWTAQNNYKGVLSYKWLDYDGAGFYEGTVVKHSAIGNGNPVGGNQQLMYPSDSGVLYSICDKKETDSEEFISGIYGRKKIESEEFEITNMFKDGVPLFHKCKLQYSIFDSNGPDDLGMYIGNSIKLLTSSMKPLNSRKYKYAVQIEALDPTGTNTELKDLYNVYIYTSFLTTSSFKVYCTYNAYNNAPGLNALDRLMPSIVEKIEVQPYYENTKDYTMTNIDAIARMNYLTITKNNIISDTRNVISFNYIVRTADNAYISNPIYAEAINVDYAFDAELSNYIERNLIVSPLLDTIPMTAYEIIKRDCAAALYDIHGNYDTTKLTLLSQKTFIAEFKDLSDSLTQNEGLVNLFTNQDGSSVVSVETTEDTGFDDGDGGYTRKISLPGKYKVWNKKIYPAYQVMCKDARLVKVLPPRESDTLENWYPRIQFSHFTQVFTDHGMSIKNIYSLPEFDRQVYSAVHGKPYIDVVDEKITILNEHTVRVKNCPLYVQLDNEYKPNNLSVRKLDINGNYKDLVISNWNYTEGIIELIDVISENDNILVTYTFEEQSYIYRGYYDSIDNFIDLDMNPSQYHNYLDHRYEPYERRPVYDLFNTVVYFFMRPSEITQTKTYGSYITSTTNTFPDTIEMNQDGYNGIGSKDGDSFIESGELSIEKIDTINNLPGPVFLDESLVTPTYSYNENGFTGTLKRDVILKDNLGSLDLPKYTDFQGIYSGDVKKPASDTRVWRQYYKGTVLDTIINTKTLYHKFGDSMPTDKYDIMLGSVHIRQNASLKSTTIIDTRTRGGGLLEEMYDSMRKALEPESDYYWDIGYWDGQPYTENAVVVIRLDRRILIDYGGRFTPEEVEKIAYKWITAGVLPIIEYVTTYTKEELPQATLNVDSTYDNKIDYTPYAFATVIQE